MRKKIYLTLFTLSSLLFGALGFNQQASTNSALAHEQSLQIRYVAPHGSYTGDCTDPIAPCLTMQYALQTATEGDEIRVARGTYTDPGGTVVHLEKTLSLSGGWRADFSERDPLAYLSILDGEGLGSVVSIFGNISPTIDGFTITGGDASLNVNDPGKGGGIYSLDASPILINNNISDNIGYTSTEVDGYGGGIYLANASATSLISANQIYSNTASSGYIGWGGGIFITKDRKSVV